MFAHRPGGRIAAEDGSQIDALVLVPRAHRAVHPAAGRAEAGFTLVEDVLLAVGTSEDSCGYPGCTITEV
jgi:hypothetical protein